MKEENNRMDEPGLTEVHEHFRRAVERVKIVRIYGVKDENAPVRNQGLFFFC